MNKTGWKKTLAHIEEDKEIVLLQMDVKTNIFKLLWGTFYV